MSIRLAASVSLLPTRSRTSARGLAPHLGICRPEITSKATFYFVIAVLVVVDIVPGGYQQKLLTIDSAAEQ